MTKTHDLKTVRKELAPKPFTHSTMHALNRAHTHAPLEAEVAEHPECHPRYEAPERECGCRQLVLPPALLHPDVDPIPLVDGRGVGPRGDRVEGAEGQIEA